MNRQAQAAVLFLVGVAVLRAGFTDLYLRYVKAGLRPLLIVAGIVLIAAAIATVWYEIRRPRATQEHQPEHEHQAEHGHAHHEPRISWLLVLPLFALILVAPPALGSYSAMRTGTALQKPWGFSALPAGDPLKLSVADYAGRAVYDHGRSLDDRQIKITGFITLDRNGAPYLTRMVLNCCAADAQPIKVGLTGQVPPVMQPDAWLEVTGTYTSKQTKDPVNDGVIPFINISQARPVPAPHNQYGD
ncbi:TIGR03943 family putative permease subunit [Streptomyces sp. NBC_01750]|uniref:TIGR03943 family putative permease subunit n=1 Tax=Streptomyces sp. NBC_01750 TaxID=2975928 RepID=UPI002DD9AE53|nr:TIGR03943 family protein [Streptomyces sp. NBC_01750]WSD36802.1 TIGR03943 family protein [Streptomyces sp. NBC_01750]